MKKLFIFLLSIMALSGAILSTGIAEGASATWQTYPVFPSASSTAFTLTTASQRLLATTTSPRRLAATIQPVNCTLGAVGAFLKMGGDQLATANTGMLAYASTTLLLGDYLNNVPVIQNAVTGITANGTCTVLVTEWRSQY
jgi:hypothetical protein